MTPPARWPAALATLALAACAPPPTDADDLDAARAVADADDAVAADAAPADAGIVHDATDAAVVPADAPPDAAADAGRRYEPVYFFTMATAAFPGARGPSVAVHVPPGFDPDAPLDVAVYFHGYNNCVANVVGATDSPCAPGGPSRNASNLLAQFDEARVHALLVVPELRPDVASGDPGAFARAGGFRAFLQELLAERLAPVLGRRRGATDVRRVSVMAHSGGYQAAAALVATGDLPALREVALLDALYGATGTFDRWVMGNVRRFVPPARENFRWVDVYTATGGTDDLSRAMARRAGEWLRAAGLAASLLDDDTPAALAPAEYARPVIFKRSALSHVDVTRYYPRRLWAASGFDPLR